MTIKPRKDKKPRTTDKPTFTKEARGIDPERQEKGTGGGVAAIEKFCKGASSTRMNSPCRRHLVVPGHQDTNGGKPLGSARSRQFFTASQT